MDTQKLTPELHYQFARSGGKGGQNVNKVATKAELRFNVRLSALLTDEERARLLDKLAHRLTTDGELVLTHQTERTQLANKQKVTAKFHRLVANALVPPKPRRATKPSRAAQQERRADKKQRSEVKTTRRKVDF